MSRAPSPTTVRGRTPGGTPATAATPAAPATLAPAATPGAINAIYAQKRGDSAFLGVDRVYR
ncbi:hypothetical protein SAMN05880568_3152 [Microbacterium sp. RURRCA19A]|nr:hypothetical protein SAMN05880568_3152 [Microbacterium sp. RURRCA19A]